MDSVTERIIKVVLDGEESCYLIGEGCDAAMIIALIRQETSTLSLAELLSGLEEEGSLFLLDRLEPLTVLETDISECR